MTKKMAAIVSKYQDKVNLWVSLFEKGHSSIVEAMEDIKYEMECFDELRTNMYHYDLLSEKDFDATAHTSYEIYKVAYDRLRDIRVSKKETKSHK